MGSLSESLYLSGVSAKIIAEKSWPGITWKLNIIMSGPDLRYNIARTTLSDSGVLSLVSLLETALKEINKLKEISFSGIYQKLIGECKEAPGSRSGIEVYVYGNRASIKMRTETYVFSRFLSEDDTVKWINELRKVPERGNQLVKMLKTIT